MELIIDMPVALIMSDHNPLTEDSGWECWGMKEEMFKNISDEFIKENLGHLDYGTVREARFYGELLEDEDPWSESFDDEDEEMDDFDPSSLYDYHIARVAYLMKNLDENPIEVDMSVDGDDYWFEVSDGNHRLLARHIAGVQNIPVVLNGFPTEYGNPEKWVQKLSV